MNTRINILKNVVINILVLALAIYTVKEKANESED